MNLDNIMSNIYGEDSSQSFDKVNLLKMQYVINRKAANVRYIDVSNDNKPTTVSYRRPVQVQKYNLTGGAVNNATTPLFLDANPFHVKDKELQDFIHTFHLEYLMANPNSNSFIVIPSAKVMKELKDDYYAELKNNNITDYDSVEASRLAAKCDKLKFKNYLFDVHGKNNGNDGYSYRLDATYPETKFNDVLRRTNRADNIYYWKFNGANAEVSASKKFTKPSILQLVGKCARSVFVFKGELPAAASNDRLKNTNVVTASLSGGAKRNNNLGLREYFNKLLRKYNNDIYAAADEFVPTIGLAEVSQTGNVKAVAQKIANYSSANLVHTAMSMLFADDNNSFNNIDLDDIESFSAEDHNAMVDAIVNEYQPKNKSINMKTAVDAITSLYNKSTTSHNPYEASKQFVSDVMKMYGKFQPSMFKADVATALLNTHRVNDSSMNFVYNVVDSMSDLINHSNYTSTSSNPLFKEQMSTRKGVTSGLTAAIYNAYNQQPFIGVAAKCGVPMFSKRHIKRSVIKNSSCSKPAKRTTKRKSVKGKSAFEDNNAIDFDDNTTAFNLIGNEGDAPEPTQPDENRYDNSDDDEIINEPTDSEDEIDNKQNAAAEAMLKSFLED